MPERANCIYLPDPSRAAVTQDIAALLARVAAALEGTAARVRWLRPAFQASAEAASAARREQLALRTHSAAVLADWPKLAPDQFTTLRAALKRHGPAA